MFLNWNLSLEVSCKMQNKFTNSIAINSSCVYWNIKLAILENEALQIFIKDGSR